MGKHNNNNNNNNNNNTPFLTKMQLLLSLVTFIIFSYCNNSWVWKDHMGLSPNLV